MVSFSWVGLLDALDIACTMEYMGIPKIPRKKNILDALVLLQKNKRWNGGTGGQTMADFLLTLATFFLISVVVISIGLLIALCVMTVKLVKLFLEDIENGK